MFINVQEVLFWFSLDDGKMVLHEGAYQSPIISKGIVIIQTHAERKHFLGF